ncbi:thiol:disulfide interchange protein DsbC [Luteimonas cucumeris]|uniref:Thiol:disulfide interchange protein n=1 Tax=Luteimonas cucumeris TaxID=985012 RepID=A0A562L5Z2_9GAMM|nr:thioredoxin fold domain-containing protein [Luteimonas cucumeris]TWI02936.1 thiol:disulfide interchange protein DsbC [Luteimonas cucumeris]
MKRLTAALLGALSLSACAQSKAPADAKPADKPAAVAASAPKVAPGTPDARAVAAIRELDQKIRIDRVGAAPLPGFREVIVAGKTLYVSDDGRYLIQGSLYDMRAKQDLSEVSLSKVRKELLKQAPLADRIVFAPPNPKYTVSVFTDIECGFCQKMHSEIAEYNKLGIEIQYLAFPRMGLGTPDYKKMVAVWCAADRKQALTAAKTGRPVPMKDCQNPVSAQYQLGQRAGLTGTPMILTANGEQLPGYLPPQAMRAYLDELAKAATATKTATSG